jgi:hypothetical protein
MIARPFALAALLFGAAPACSQPVTPAEAEQAITQVQASHIQGNVPDGPEFARLLERDLNAHFAARGVANVATRAEPLREGATQSGAAYPKFYFWVQVFSGRGLVNSGAARAAAVQKLRFEITDFLSAEEIINEPERVASIFPAPLLEAIRERARVVSSGH